MPVTWYRALVIGSVASAFLTGMHVPVLHDIVEHGAAPRSDVLLATLVLAVAAVAGTWRLIGRGGP
jgi:hypothetical protein